MLKSLSVFPCHDMPQVKAATQEAESTTPPLTITAESVASATTTQVTKVTAHGLVLLGATGANQGLKNADSTSNILFLLFLIAQAIFYFDFFILNYGKILNFVDKTLRLIFVCVSMF